MSKVRVWKDGTTGEPKYPDNFDVVKKAVLQITDIKTNRNKYYAIELHKSGTKFRVFTHYGRTDDLETNPNAGVRESRYCSSLVEAQSVYDTIYKQKTSARKGYKEVNLASSRIGSSKSVGKSSGHVDDATLEKMANNDKDDKKDKPKVSVLPKSVQTFVEYIYAEATNALTSTVNASITANGIETPLGVLTLGQIEKGQSILDELYELIKSKKKTEKVKSKMTDLSGEFYTVIPHRIGRTRQAAEQAIITTLDDFSQKNDTLQLMRDMLAVSSKDTSVLVNPEIDKKYKALGCDIRALGSDEFHKIKKYVEKSQLGSGLKVKTAYGIGRPPEIKSFHNVGNIKQLFHGSGSENWVGILSRGLLLPKVVVSLGVHRTDAGWLGNGIYFGDTISTTVGYAHPGSRGTRMAAVVDVALGKIKQYSKITYGLNSPPSGYNSCHGIRGTQFHDDEFVIYNQNQQKLKYLIEYSAGRYW